MLTVAEAISFQVETAFGPATVIVTGWSWGGSSPPPQAPSRLAAEMTAPMATLLVTDTGRAKRPNITVEGRREVAPEACGRIVFIDEISSCRAGAPGVLPQGPS